MTPTEKLMITGAPTGGMTFKAQNPHLPTQPAEIAESVLGLPTHRTQAGAVARESIAR